MRSATSGTALLPTTASGVLVKDAPWLAKQAHGHGGARVVVRVVLRSLVHICKLEIWDEYAWHAQAQMPSAILSFRPNMSTSNGQAILHHELCVTVAAAETVKRQASERVYTCGIGMQTA